jgi:thymidylate kinase
MFVVIVGPDGSGKTSILAQMKQLGYRTVSWKDMTFFIIVMSMYSIFSGLVKPVRCLGDFMSQLNPVLRSCLHLIMWDILYQNMVDPYRQGETIIVDSYIYKVLAKESLYGVCPRWFFQAMKDFHAPDKVIIIQGEHKSSQELSLFENLDPSEVLNKIQYFVTEIHPTALVNNIANEVGKLSETVQTIVGILEA